MNITLQPRMLALHGFWGSGADFDGLRASSEKLGLRADWHCPDLPGHGLQSAGQNWPTLTQHASSLAQEINLHWEKTGQTTLLLGYSMGGRLALLTALLHSLPSLSGLVLISCSPGLSDPAQATVRASNDDLLAAQLGDPAVPLREILWDFWQQPVFCSPHWPPTSDSEWVLRRLRANRHALAGILRSWSVGRQPNLWPDLPRFSRPVLLVHGACDEKFAAIHHRMAQALPCAEHVCLEDCGHVALAEQPHALAASLARWWKVPFPLASVPS
jgi:2-succinyl-6-hydroxy-2,4-cyclohexadiene-1-carboxylate synthase